MVALKNKNEEMGRDDLLSFLNAPWELLVEVISDQFHISILSFCNLITDLCWECLHTSCPAVLYMNNAVIPIEKQLLKTNFEESYP